MITMACARVSVPSNASPAVRDGICFFSQVGRINVRFLDILC
jgi:hypothetical protein